MKGYWNRPEETQKTLRDGWLFTGDIGAMDDEGYLKIVGRKKELIKCSDTCNNPGRQSFIVFILSHLRDSNT